MKVLLAKTQPLGDSTKNPEFFATFLVLLKTGLFAKFFEALSFVILSTLSFFHKFIALVYF
jgi:hypothetical protein